MGFLSRLLCISSVIAIMTCSVASAQPIESGLKPFFNAVYANEQKSPNAPMARITWWGDSAAASDGYTGVIRAKLQRAYGDGGAGFVLLDPTYKGYLHKRIRLKRTGWKTHSVLSKVRRKRFGLAGVVSTSYGGASSTFISRSGSWTRAQIFYEGSPNSGDLSVFINGQPQAMITTSTRRDTLEDDIWEIDLPKNTTKFRLRAAGRGLVRVFGVVLETTGPGITLDTLGMVGLRARGLLRNNGTHFAKHVNMRGTNLLVVQFGGNERVDPHLTEARHKSEMVRLLRAIKKGAKTASCLVVAPFPHGKLIRGRIRLDPALVTITTAQRAAAQDEGCAFYDSITALGGEKGVREMRKKKWLARDMAHLTSLGHREIGTRIASWIEARYNAWKLKQANVKKAPDCVKDEQSGL
jgi:lysophospholipase L1-like esterase